MFTCVETESVDTEFFHVTWDPRSQRACYFVVLVVEIHEHHSVRRHPAAGQLHQASTEDLRKHSPLLFRVMVVPDYVAFRMIIRLMLEKQTSPFSSSQRSVGNVRRLRSYSIDSDINHQQHSSVMYRRRERFEVVGRPKVRVELGRVRHPEALLISHQEHARRIRRIEWCLKTGSTYVEGLSVLGEPFNVLSSWTDPDCVVPHPSDIIQFPNDRSVVSTAVSSIFGITWRSFGRGCESISQQSE